VQMTGVSAGQEGGKVYFSYTNRLPSR